jgi:hypothetical protein
MKLAEDIGVLHKLPGGGTISEKGRNHCGNL